MSFSSWERGLEFISINCHKKTAQKKMCCFFMKESIIVIIVNEASVEKDELPDLNPYSGE